MTNALMDYFNRSPRIGTLSTAGADGQVDAAVMGSARMIDETTVIMALGPNRSLSNLQQNPHAVYMIVEPGASIGDWKGVRVYLVVRGIEESGPALDEYRRQVARVIGEEGAAMLRALVRCEITEVRTLVDMGRPWAPLTT